ncbi:MAG: DUF6869 domain-containing protein [Patescibacteria group bacterium]
MSTVNSDNHLIAKKYISEYEEKNLEGNFSPNSISIDEYLVDLIETDPERVLEIIELIVNSTSNKKLIFFLAAGPFENLLEQKGNLIFDDIENKIRKNPKLRVALGGVWINKENHEKVWSLIQKYKISETE